MDRLISETEKLVMHIDMNSYFATVEQQMNPYLRGKPIAVCGRPNTRSVVSAASVEAKRFGVRSGMNTYEARRICPNLILIPGDSSRYLAVSEKFFEILKKYSDKIEVFSIDEAFMELAQPNNQIDNCLKIAYEIKRDIKEKLGDYLTCSIGIAKNKLLAKLASEKQKPDGLTVIDDQNLEFHIKTSQLEDFCGIGRQTKKKLFSLGINTMEKMQEIPLDYLISIFKEKKGHFLYDTARGVDQNAVTPTSGAVQKTYSHNITLPKDSDDQKYIWATILRLSEKVGFRMRRDKVVGKSVGISLSIDYHDGFSIEKKMTVPTDRGIVLYGFLKEHVLSKKLPEKIRSIGVRVGDISINDVTMDDVFGNSKKWRQIQSSVDHINDRYGNSSILRASTISCINQEKNVAGIRTKLRFH